MIVAHATPPATRHFNRPPVVPAKRDDVRRSKQRLTDLTVRNLKPHGARRQVQDADIPGFGVLVTATGLKTFFFRYQINGSEHRFRIGPYPAMSLNQARKRAVTLSGQVLDGKNPQAIKAEVRQAETFSEVARLYIEKHAEREKASWQEDQRKIERDLLPRWGKRKMKDIRRREIIDLLEDVADGKGDGRRQPGQPAPISANRLGALISKLFTFALDRKVIDTNPAHRLPRPGTERAKDRVLSEEEIQSVWSALDGMPPATAAAWRLILLTGQRPGEVSRMRWEDLRQEPGGWTWTLPRAYMKNRRFFQKRDRSDPHLVPLSPQAQAEIEALRPVSGAEKWVLPSRNRGKRLANLRRSNQRFLELTGIEPRFTPNDLQRTASTLMQKFDVDPTVIDWIQDHLDSSSVRATYQRHGYGVEMRRALMLLGNRVEAIVTGKDEPTNVVRIA
jgi:integrase